MGNPTGQFSEADFLVIGEGRERSRRFTVRHDAERVQHIRISKSGWRQLGRFSTSGNRKWGSKGQHQDPWL